MVNGKSWAIAFNTTTLAFDNKLINTVYAAPGYTNGFFGAGTIRYICIDSSGKNVERSITVSSYVNLTNVTGIDSSNIMTCNS